MASEAKYKELAYADIRENVSLVISKYLDNSFTIAQRVKFEEESKNMNIFLKGAIQINDISGLINLRDALNVAIEKIEKEN